MPEIKLFIAVTLDGFIAREDGSLDWLPGSDPETTAPEANSESEVNDGGYAEFISEIDIVVMGKKTYEEVLGFGVEWPYGDQISYVLTSDKNYITKTNNTFTSDKLDQRFINKMKTESKKNIWVVGGGKIITQFLNHDAINEIILSVFPIILGKGIPLFPDNPKETKLKLINTEKFESGFVNLTYRRL